MQYAPVLPAVNDHEYVIVYWHDHVYLARGELQIIKDAHTASLCNMVSHPRIEHGLPFCFACTLVTWDFLVMLLLLIVQCAEMRQYVCRPFPRLATFVCMLVLRVFVFCPRTRFWHLRCIILTTVRNYLWLVVLTIQLGRMVRPYGGIRSIGRGYQWGYQWVLVV